MPQLHPDAYEDNVPGRYFVEKSCIDCGLCPQLVPAVFRQSDDATHSIVYQQPASPEEIAQAEDAMAQCPTSSIRNDGEPAQAGTSIADAAPA